MEQEVPESSSSQPSPRRRRPLLKWLIIAAGVIVLLTIVCCIALVLYTETPQFEATATARAIVRATASAQPSSTPVPTDTPVPTGTSTPTSTPPPTSTSPPTSKLPPTGTTTFTPVPTNTPTQMQVSTPSPEPTTTPSPTDTPYPMQLVFDVDAYSERGHIYVSVRTNLSDGVELIVELYRPDKVSAGLASDRERARIRDGLVEVGPFTFVGGAWPPDEYVITVTSSEYVPKRTQEFLEKSNSEYVADGRISYMMPFVIGQVVTAEEFGSDWPLTVERGVVGCDWGALRKSSVVVFRYNNRNYVMSGALEEAIHAMPGWDDIADIQRDDPDEPGHKIDIGPLLVTALEVCE